MKNKIKSQQNGSRLLSNWIQRIISFKLKNGITFKFLFHYIYYLDPILSNLQILYVNLQCWTTAFIKYASIFYIRKHSRLLLKGNHSCKFTSFFEFHRIDTWLEIERIRREKIRVLSYKLLVAKVHSWQGFIETKFLGKSFEVNF